MQNIQVLDRGHSTATFSGRQIVVSSPFHLPRTFGRHAKGAQDTYTRRKKCTQLTRSVASPLIDSTNGACGSVKDQEDGVKQEFTSAFKWSKHWYPVSVVSCLDKEKPNKVTLLGRDYVVWWAENTWNAAKDECPHRFAPLSVGRVAEDKLYCRYHGWGFVGGKEGRCACNPQADTPHAAASITQGSRARLQTHPAQVQQGLLWVWPESGADAWLEASAFPLDAVPEMVDPSYAGAEGEFAFMENPASHAVMVENALDPSHASYVHNLVISKREDAAPMQMKLHGPIDPQRGFQLEHTGYSRSQQAKGMKAKRWFIPPCTIRTHYTYDSGREDMTTLYLVPVAPGVTRAYNKVVVKGVPTSARRIFNFLAKRLLSSGMFHAFGHGLVDQDMNVLHSQERKLMRKSKGWRDYYCATQSDAGVTAFWRWLTTYAGGGITWSDGVSSELPPQKSNEELLNHYDRHTKYCPACQKAIKRLDQVLFGLLVAGIATFAAAGLVIPAEAGLHLGRLFLPYQVLLGALGLVLLYMRTPVQSFRRRFFKADSVIG